MKKGKGKQRKKLIILDYRHGTVKVKDFEGEDVLATDPDITEDCHYMVWDGTILGPQQEIILREM